jgi:hypothetical protein
LRCPFFEWECKVNWLILFDKIIFQKRLEKYPDKSFLRTPLFVLRGANIGRFFHSFKINSSFFLRFPETLTGKGFQAKE